MRRMLSVCAVIVGAWLVPVGLGAQTGYGQVTLENRTSRTLDLYHDGTYGCRALKSLTCTTQVKAGKDIKLSAKDGDEVVATHTIEELESGGSMTWTLTE